MKNYTIKSQFVVDLFKRAMFYIGELSRHDASVGEVDWENNDLFYKASAAWKDFPTHYLVTGLKYEEYGKFKGKHNYYVLYGIAESFYELGFMLVYDLDAGLPCLRLYRDGVRLMAED